MFTTECEHENRPCVHSPEDKRLILQLREKYRQNYLKRRANGKQAEHDSRFKERVNARKASVKAELLEDLLF